MKTHKSIDEYINDFPENVQKILINYRNIIKKTVPNATEVITYGIPTFKLNGKNMVHFGGFKDHTSFFPTSEPIKVFAKELKKFKLSKGTIQVPLEETLSDKLIKSIVEFRRDRILQKK